MKDYNEEDIKPSDKAQISMSESNQDGLNEQILNNETKLKRIEKDIEELRSNITELKKDKTPYGMIMNSPVIFVIGIIIGLIIAVFNYIFVLNNVKQDLKYIKQERKELIEYVDKAMIRVTSRH